MSEERFGALLTAGDVAALLGAFEIQPQHGSPLSLIEEIGEEPDGATPSDGATFGDEWLPAVEVLAAPNRRIRAIIPGPAETLIQTFYGRRAHPDVGLVGCWPEGDGLRVTFPWAEDDVVAVTSGVVLTTPPPLADGRELSLSVGGLEVLAASIDALRDRLFSSMGSRHPEIDMRFDRDDLQRQFEMGADNIDARWLVTLLRILSPPDRGVSSEEIVSGYDELIAAGVIVADDGRWTPGRPLIDLATWWRSPLPAVAHEVIETVGGRLERHDHRITIRGDGPLTRIDYRNLTSDTASVTMGTLDAADLVASLTEFLDPVDAVVPEWVYVLDPTAVHGVDDPSLVVGSLLPARWYLRSATEGNWARVSDPDGPIEGWVAAEALHIDGDEARHHQHADEPQEPLTEPGPANPSPPEQQVTEAPESTSPGGARGWKITGIVVLALVAAWWALALVEVAVNPIDIGELFLGTAILTALPIGFGIFALMRSTRASTDGPSGRTQRPLPVTQGRDPAPTPDQDGADATPDSADPHAAGGAPPDEEQPVTPQPQTETPSWTASHVVPAGGLRSWSVPDGSTAPLADLAAGVELLVVERRADWARVRAENGWEAWVDGRQLSPVSTDEPPPLPALDEEAPTVAPPS